MKFKKVLAFLLAALMLFGLGACAPKATEDSDSDDSSQNTLEAIKSRGTLRLGTSADYPPYEFHISVDGKDTIVGFDVEIGKEIAKDMGVELEIVDMSFEGLLAALQAGTIDVVIAGMTPDEERKEAADFSDIYYYAEQGVLIRTEDADKYTSVDAFEGLDVGAQKGAIQETIAQEQLTGSNVKGLTKIGPLVLELKTKKVEAVVMEKPVAENYISQHPDLMLANIELVDETGGSAVATNKNQPELLEAINTTIKRLLDEGLIDKYVAEANILSDQLVEE
ncbi:MAG: ABC transporter substrate-binding protein [Christensenellales bacterium]|jgi:ABC-type amino acid transport substrate-binding protein